MATGIASASTTQAGAALHFEVCPTWTNGACACAKDASGDPQPPHPRHAFSAMTAGWVLASPPAEWLALGHTTAQWSALTPPQQWSASCAIEAIRLVKAQQPAAPTALPSLVGLSA